MLGFCLWFGVVGRWFCYLCCDFGVACVGGLNWSFELRFWDWLC